MAPARLIIRKLPRGEYEIGTHTEDGAIVARVGVWDGRSIDQRSEEERQAIALEQVRRLIVALEDALEEAEG
jgi:hypothetical protein